MKEIIVLKESKNRITDAKELFRNIKKIEIDYSQENFIVVCLKSNGEIANSKILFKGGLNSCVIDAKTIFRYALLENANSIIIAHNHPSNDLRPSKEDIKIFETLKQGGKLLDLIVWDSIIFNETQFYSIV